MINEQTKTRLIDDAMDYIVKEAHLGGMCSTGSGIFEWSSCAPLGKEWSNRVREMIEHVVYTISPLEDEEGDEE